MTFKARTYRKWVRRLALGLALAAIAAPSAQAIGVGGQPPPRHDDGPRPGNLVTAPVELPAIEVDSNGYLQAKPSVGPTDVPTPQVTIPEGWGNAQFGPANFVTVPSASPSVPLGDPSPTAPVATPEFDWADAGVGIAIGAGLALLLAAGLMLGRRRGRFASA